jgi:hypothetical protein
MPKVLTGQDTLIVFYRFLWENGEQFCFAVSPLQPEVAREVIGTLSEDYSLVIPIIPAGKAWAFLRGYIIPEDYIRTSCFLDARTASLLFALMPSLTQVRPADDLLDLAIAWRNAHPSGGQE